ncbi:flagellar biosynthesis anti-sigma factor FlgM [Pseudoalteromonas shioyasakiensis]|uniref:flagellar biosynthesis anti-sigma factor FlgM n=1 Tax=Pseudoalteromonas shioyasakiensis TaxID=1190813 RepID=UPI00211813A3|nr:flagellar biosynthesis anti-sigma factor FlgM [Pseudoalteromonas shioyasakiensis]MCQ8877521.1 flagellar biosynthesis anti-sigma factor FlgM [Pseudoalteromonas shioyasakiensis]
MNITNKPSVAVEQNQKVNNSFGQSVHSESSNHKKAAEQPVSTRNQVSALSKSIDSTFETLSSQSNVDLQKVAEVKAAIANGSFKLDEATLVDTLLEYHKK